MDRHAARPGGRAGVRRRLRGRFDPAARALAAGLLVGGMLWWPSDLLVLRRLPGAAGPYARWRAVLGVVTLLYVALPRTAAVRAHAPALFFTLTLVGSALVAWLQAPLGGPETPWFHLLYVMPFCSMPLPLRPAARAGFTAALAAATLAGYVLPFAAHRASPFVPWMCSFFVATSAMSVVFGHALYAAMRENFFQARALARQNETLEQRVAERTGELRRLVDHVERSREAERKRIARDLHDDLGQELVALRYAVSHCETRLRKGGADLDAEFAGVQDHVQRVRASMRTLLNDLRPMVLDELGLRAATDWLLRGTARRTGLACSLDVTGEDIDALDPQLGAEAYRIVQESLTNVIRHAQATRVDVRLDAGRGVLTGVILDDGVGLAGSRGTDGGFGLVGMRERAAALGGTLTVEGRDGGGTEVRFCLPRADAKAVREEPLP
ncbi:MAG: sensor histidine kinase [Polyangiales bacterium]